MIELAVVCRIDANQFVDSCRPDNLFGETRQIRIARPDGLNANITIVEFMATLHSIIAVSQNGYGYDAHPLKKDPPQMKIKNKYISKT